MTKFIENLISQIEGEFSFLITDFGYELIEIKNTGLALIVCYKSSFKCVKISYDYREREVYVEVCLLKNDKIPSYTDWGFCKSIFEILTIKNISYDEEFVGRRYNDNQNYLRYVAELMRQNCVDVLSSKNLI